MTNSTVAPKPRSARVLVVDDDELVRWTLKERLAEDGHEVIEAASAQAALAALDEEIHLALLDYKLPDGDGMVLLARFCEARPDVPVIMMTAHSSVEQAVTAIKAGAHHYVSKPFDIDALAITVGHALALYALQRQLRRLHQRKNGDSAIIGASAPMREVERLIPRIAASRSSTVLITGESGTGKDLAARAIHDTSERAEQPFVNITCSALPGELLESELFGHERGAFTDAKARKEGLLQQADGGTVFLDEIAEMSPAMQAKLLRFLEAKTFRRVGGAQEIRADVRVIAATHVDLKEAVLEKRFREDLYYRLAVVTLHLPPLRERGEDIELIAAHLVNRYSHEFQKRVSAFSPAAQQMLRTHPWPGNVRELRNAIERAVLLAEGEVLDVDDFGFLQETAIDPAVVRLPAGGVNMRELERSLVTQALERTHGNQTRAAALLGMNRDQIRYRMRRYGLLAEGHEALAD